MDHYEIWGGFCDDSERGIDEEFLETAMSWDEARTACDEYRKQPNRYASIRNMDTGFRMSY